MQMRKSRGRMRLNITGMRGRRGDYAQRSGKRFVNGMMTKGMEQTPLSYPSLRHPSSDPTRTTRSRDQKIQALKRQVQAVRAELDSLEMRTRTVRYGSTVSGIRVSVDTDRCVGCGICQSVCPAGAISVENVALVDSGRCTGCRLCLDQCPVGALSIIPLKNPQGEEACAVP
jgi:NAD-dependent dihydropyrimidine dehydrogenase PreA subunit